MNLATSRPLLSNTIMRLCNYWLNYLLWPFQIHVKDHSTDECSSHFFRLQRILVVPSSSKPRIFFVSEPINNWLDSNQWLEALTLYLFAVSNPVNASNNSTCCLTNNWSTCNRYSLKESILFCQYTSHYAVNIMFKFSPEA